MIKGARQIEAILAVHMTGIRQSRYGTPLGGHGGWTWRFGPRNGENTIDVYAPANTPFAEVVKTTQVEYERAQISR